MVARTDTHESFAPPPIPLSTAASLAALKPPEPALLGPIAPGTITAIRGARGVGKSWLALAMAHAVASGGALLGWRARSAPVLYVEAAMSGALFGARLRALGPAPGLQVMVDLPLDLSGSDDQARLFDLLPEGGVLVLDGLSLLARGGRDAREAFAGWLRMLRRAGHAVVLVEPSPSSVLAAIADTLITIRRGDGEAGLSCAVAIASRQTLAAADRAFRADLDSADGRAQWRRAALVPPELRDVIAAARQGGTVREIAARAGLATGTAWRRLDKARALGLIEAAGGTGGTAAGAAEPVREGAAGQERSADRERRGTGGTAPRPDLAAVSTEVLKRTLARRRQAQGRGAHERPGPAILAGVADAELAAECARRLKPPQAARLLAEYGAAAE